MTIEQALRKAEVEDVCVRPVRWRKNGNGVMFKYGRFWRIPSEVPSRYYPAVGEISGEWEEFEPSIQDLLRAKGSCQ